MLSPKQEKFVQCIIEGMNQSDAYRSAYSTKNMTDKSIWESASHLMNDIKVSSRINELREKIINESIMTATERLKWLSDVVKNSEVTWTDRLRASDQMNKMQGEYTQKIEANVSGETNIRIELVDD